MTEERVSTVDSEWEEAFLAHHGVKGMKWGVRKRVAPSVRSAARAKSKESRRNVKAQNRQVRQNASLKRGQDRLKKYGGSASKAGWTIVGRNVVVGLLAGVGTQAVAGILTAAAGEKHAQTIAVGHSVVNGVLSYGLAARDIRTGIDLKRATDARKADFYEKERKKL